MAPCLNNTCYRDILTKTLIQLKRRWPFAGQRWYFCPKSSSIKNVLLTKCSRPNNVMTGWRKIMGSWMSGYHPYSVKTSDIRHSRNCNLEQNIYSKELIDP